MPLTETAALRVSAFSKRDGGFIDNVKGEYTFRHGYIRDGLVAGGYTEEQAAEMAPDFTYNNYTAGDIGNVAEENFNEATTTIPSSESMVMIDTSESFSIGSVRSF